MERALFSKYKDTLADDEASFLQEMISDCDDDVEHCRKVVEGSFVKDRTNRYKTFFHGIIDGQHRSKAAYWVM